MISDSSKAQIRLFLGYPDYFRYKDTRLESVLNNLSFDAEDQIAGIITTLQTVDGLLLAAGKQAGVKRVNEIWFENGWRRIAEVRKLGRTYVGRLSIIVGVPPYSDYFGTGGYIGDNFSLGGRGNGTGGGFFNLG